MLRIALWAGQNVVNSRNVMCNGAKIFVKFIDKPIDEITETGNNETDVAIIWT
jgi:hypothetical protein